MRSSSLRFCAVAVACVALLAPAAAWAKANAQEDTHAAQLPAIRLTKIQFDPPSDDDLTNSSLNKEWVQFHNSGVKTWTLTGWLIRDVTGFRYKFPEGFTVAPGATVTIHTGSGKNRPLHLYWGQGTYIWNNTGDKATLKNSAGKVVDTCAYDSTGSWVSC